jgi:DNA-binding transcriptional MocR family regulator
MPRSSPRHGGEKVIDFAVAAPAADPGAIEAAAAAAMAGLREELTGPTGTAGGGYYPTGVPLLREAIAGRYRARGVATAAEQILVTAGAMGAVHLLACSVFSRGGTMLVEQPTYPTALDALRATPGRLVPFPVTSAGWDLERMASVFRRLRPRFAYLIVDFHNPTGALLDLPGRQMLVAAAREAGTLLVVDETNLELDLDGRSLPPPLAALDADARVLSVGSMSKAFWGGLRVGWIRAAPTLVAELAAARHRIDLANPVLDQLVAAHLLAHADEHLPARRGELAARRDVLAGALRAARPQWHWRLPTGGLCLWVLLDDAVSTRLMTTALRHGLRLVHGPRFGLGETPEQQAALERFVRLPYVLPPAALREGVRRLAAAHDELAEPAEPAEPAGRQASAGGVQRRLTVTPGGSG